MSKDSVKTQIDTDIINKTTSKSISPLNVGSNMKAVVDLIPEGGTQDLQSVLDNGANYTSEDERNNFFLSPEILIGKNNEDYDSYFTFTNNSIPLLHTQNLNNATTTNFTFLGESTNTTRVLIPSKNVDGDYILATLDDIIDSRPYKVYTALLTQLDTDAPVPSILENTLGDITFSRISIGTYRIESTGLFTLNKTIYFINVPEQVLGDNMGVKNTQLQNINQLNFVTYISSSDQIADNVLIPTSFIEIRVYN